VESWIKQRRVPGGVATALLRAACITIMRGYARGRLREAVRVTRNPRVLAMTEDQISRYVEAAIHTVLRYDTVRERHELIENAMYTSLARTSDDEYTNMWVDVQKSVLESPTFRGVREELLHASNNAFDITRRARPPATPATPAGTAPLKRRKISP
jgi:hypothetical protein